MPELSPSSAHRRSSSGKRDPPPPLSPTPTSASERTVDPAIANNRFLSDRLGALVSNLSASLSTAASWDEFIASVSGNSYLSSTVHDLPHPAGPFLAVLCDDGAPVPTTNQPWSDSHLDDCVHLGPHQSACAHSDFVRENMANNIDEGFWIVLPCDQVKHPPGLQLSPMGVAPQRDR